MKKVKLENLKKGIKFRFPYGKIVWTKLDPATGPKWERTIPAKNYRQRIK